MATIVNVGGTTLHGPNNWDILTEVMVSAQMKNARMKVPAKRRYAEAVTRAAIRRDGYTDANQRLIMSGAERQEWEDANPLED
jgi:hypothetical protein